jgi:hypothetical protein
MRDLFWCDLVPFAARAPELTNAQSDSVLRSRFGFKPMSGSGQWLFTKSEP